MLIMKVEEKIKFLSSITTQIVAFSPSVHHLPLLHPHLPHCASQYTNETSWRHDNKY